MSDIENASISEEDSFGKVNVKELDLGNSPKVPNTRPEDVSISTGIGTMPPENERREAAVNQYSPTAAEGLNQISSFSHGSILPPPPPPPPINRSIRMDEDLPNYDYATGQAVLTGESAAKSKEKTRSKTALKIHETYMRPKTQKILGLLVSIICWVYAGIAFIYAISEFFSFMPLGSAITGLLYNIMIAAMSVFVGIYQFKRGINVDAIVVKEFHFLSSPLGLGLSLIGLSIFFQPPFYVDGSFWGVMSLFKTIISLCILMLGIAICVFGCV